MIHEIVKFVFRRFTVAIRWRRYLDTSTALLGNQRAYLVIYFVSRDSTVGRDARLSSGINSPRESTYVFLLVTLVVACRLDQREKMYGMSALSDSKLDRVDVLATSKRRVNYQ